MDAATLKAAGFSDAEIQKHTNEQRLLAAGFSPEEIAASASTTPAAPAASTAPASSFGRTAGLTARDVIEGGMGLPGMAIDVMTLPGRALVKGYEAITGKETALGKTPTFGQITSEKLTQAGLPKPETPGERYASALRQGLVGTASGLGMGGALRTAAPAVSEFLTAKPTLQMASAAPAALASQAAGEAVGDSPYAPLAQIGAGMVGGMTPSAATAFGRKLATPLKIYNPPETQRLIQIAEEEGINLTPGIKSGSRPLQATESVLSTLPFSSGPQRQVYAKTREQFNQAVLKKAGIDSKYASPPVMKKAFDDIGEEFDSLTDNTPPLKVTPEFEKKINDVFYNNIFKISRRLDANQAPVFANYVEDFDNLFKLAKTSGKAEIDPKSYKELASDLRQSIRNTQDENLKSALGKLQNALDDLLEQNSSKQLKSQWSDVRNRYRNLMIVDKAVGGGTAENRLAGDIPFGSFRQAVDSADAAGFGRGRGEYNDLARVGDLLTQKIPNSGTPERSFLQKFATDPVGALTGPAALGAAGITATASLPAAAIGLATPYTLQKFINSPAGSRYLLNQKYAGPSPMAYGKEQAARNLITALTSYQRPNYEDFTK